MILLAAATPWESGPLARALGLTQVSPGLFEGRVGRHEVALLETGMGQAGVQKTFARFHGSPEAVISAGLAGGLQPGLRTGDIVADFREAPIVFVETARRAADKLSLILRIGKIVSCDHVLSSPEEKRALGARQRALAVDMESEALRAWAARAGASFLTIRAVLDGVEDEVLRDAPRSPSLPDSLRYALRHWRDLPLLVRLAWGQKRAMARLAGYFRQYLSGLDMYERHT